MIPRVILAAGASSRMGTPKALLEYRGETFLERLIRVLGASGDPVIVALGYHAAEIRSGVSMPRAARAIFAVNPAPERGQLSSLQTALAELAPDAEGFAFIPVDCPAVRESTVLRLHAAFAARDSTKLFVIPRSGEHHGHPVFAAPAIAREILALPATAQARDVVHAHVDQTRYLDVGDPGILADVDDPESYRRLIEAAS